MRAQTFTTMLEKKQRCKDTFTLFHVGLSSIKPDLTRETKKGSTVSYLVSCFDLSVRDIVLSNSSIICPNINDIHSWRYNVIKLQLSIYSAQLS